MKRLFAIILICLTLTACNQDGSPETTVPATAAPTETAAPVTYPVPTAEEMPLSDMETDWGLTLTAEKIRSTNCILRYTQSGGAPTGQLQTGAFFAVEVFDGQWKPAVNLHPNEEIAWNDLAYLITMDAETEMTEDWSHLHGPLMPGWYRIGKEVMDFRGPGDYDKAMFYAYFEITK